MTWDVGRGSLVFVTKPAGPVVNNHKEKVPVKIHPSKVPKFASHLSIAHLLAVSVAITA